MEKSIFVRAAAAVGEVLTRKRRAKKHREHGWTFYEDKNYANALAAFNKAVELDPAAADGYFARAVIYYRTAKIKDEWGKAVKDFEKALEINPNMNGYAYVYLADSYFRIGDNENARFYVNKALQVNMELRNKNVGALAWRVTADIEKAEA